MIREDFGPDAVVLKTKTNRKGFGLLSGKSVEVTAAVSKESIEKKKFFDYVDKNYKGEKEEQVSEGSCDSSKKKKYEYVELDEAKVSFVFHDKAEAKQFATKVKSFVDNVEIQKIASVGQFNVILTGEKEGFKKAVAVAVKMSGE